MSKVTTKHSDIVRWWLGKHILKDGTVTTEPGENDSVMVLCDLGEPSCWACGKPIISPTEGEAKKWTEVWDNSYVKSHLERCHILAESLGGKDEPGNLFLMCPRCHAESPDVRNTSAFFRWVYDKNKTHCFGHVNEETLAKEIDDELERRGERRLQELFTSLPEHKRKQFSSLIAERSRKQDLNAYVRDRVTTHWTTLNHNSLIIGVVDCILHYYTQVLFE